jgi:hypothetical protein
MNFQLSQFKEIVSDFYNVTQKYITDGQVNIDYNYNEQYKIEYRLSYVSLLFENVEKLYEFSKVLPVPITGLDIAKVVQAEGMAAPARQRTEAQAKLIKDINASLTMNNAMLQPIAKEQVVRFKSIKLVPKTVDAKFVPYVIAKSPVETTEGDFTYRFIVDTSQTNDNRGHHIQLISRNDDDMYDYLDQGFFIMPIRTNKSKRTKYIISDEYDINVAHVFAMCSIQHSLIENLKNNCFISVYDAELLRLKLAKRLTDKSKKIYAPVSEAIEKDYRDNTTLVVVNKLKNNELEKTTLNNIVFTKTSATYENVSIEANDLIDVLYEQLNFNGEFDIYTIAELYGNHLQTKLDAAQNALQIPTFKINGMDIDLNVTATFQRYVNGARINRDEIGKVIHRATCYREADKYKLFLKSISRMSMKWHDVIANGLGVKIHDMDDDEFRSEVPSLKAPALKFFIDAEQRQIKLVIDEDRSVRVSLSKLVKKVENVNKRTNNAYIYGGYYGNRNNGHNRKDGSWAVSQLIPILVEACTFMVDDEAAVKIVDANGKAAKVKKKVVGVTKEDIVKLFGIVKKKKIAAIERSKEFLDKAVKLSGAQLVEFMGKQAYKVQGILRTYAVVIENAKVYDFDTKQYRCIVNDRHYKGAGYDDIATRLLMLKNDSVFQNQINTLRGAAQPGAEHAHDDYRPERDPGDIIDNALNMALQGVEID